MLYKILNNNWNAEPNAPLVEISCVNSKLSIEFELNSFLYENIKEGEVGTLLFNDVVTYRYGNPNDEGFYRGESKYSKVIPWGEFLELEDDELEGTFDDIQIVSKKNENLKYKHYLFHFRDNTFECIATGYEFSINNMTNYKDDQ